MAKKILLVTALFFFSCSKHESFVPVYSVPPEFQGIIETFIKEAAKRGHTIVINNLIVKYDSTLSIPFCGEANTSSPDNNIQKVITLNPQLHCWNNDLELETLIFHELGHCTLGRSHTSELLPNGDPKSIMIPDNISLYSPCVYAINDSCIDVSFKRTYYIDELFDTKTPIPEWAK